MSKNRVLRPQEIWSKTAGVLMRQFAAEIQGDPEELANYKQLVDKIDVLTNGYWNTTILLALATVFDTMLNNALEVEEVEDAGPDPKAPNN